MRIAIWPCGEPSLERVRQRPYDAIESNDARVDMKADNKMRAARPNRRLLLSFAAGLLMPALAQAQEIEGDGKTGLADTGSSLGDMVLGAADAPVTLVEYASASCPHCAAFYQSHFGALKAAYIDKGKLRFVLREYPHDDAALAAFMVARCAPPAQYFAYLDRFFTTQDEWTAKPREGLMTIALSFGMRADAFERCITNVDLSKAILAGRDVARSGGVTDVPAFFINGVPFEGEKTYEAIGPEIDRLLQQ